jgi:NAD(P)-dependent dehydrogenase (short-subunit alcohol dehydrogenase family)
MKSPYRLKDQIALITGGANGSGAASVKAFAEEGAKVVFIDRDALAGRALEARLKRENQDVHFIEADVSHATQVERAIAEGFALYGRFDILFNHAGIMLVKPFLDITIAEWDLLMDNNAKSAFLVTRLVLPRMLEQGHGVIINTSTTGVKAATHMESVYCASKAAMHQLARNIAVEFRDRGIRCNNICPSFVRTKHGEDEIVQLRAHGILASEHDVNVMQGRICEPEEIASVAVFLASDESSFINGAEIFVDNTFTAV